MQLTMLSLPLLALVSSQQGKEHEEESHCSINFGRRFSAVSNLAKIEGVRRVTEGETADLHETIRREKCTLERMRKNGEGLTFAQGSSKSECESYKSNLRKTAVAEGRLLESKKKLLEIKSSRNSNKEELDALEAKVKSIETDASNLKSILMRQESIKGFVKKPTMRYKKLETRLTELESKMAMLPSF